MNLLNKISAIEIKADTRISEEDRKVCQTHQKAYKRAREMFLLLDEQWSAFVDEEQEIMSAVTDDSYIRERYYHTESFSIASIRNKIEYLPELLIYSIVHYFNDKYHVSVADDEVKKVLIPPQPKYDWEKSRIAEYHEKMKNMELRYEDILEQIFVQLGGRTFEERALDELKEMCHDFAWNTHYNKALYEIKNDTIQFTGRGCRYKYYYSQGEWE